MILHVDGMYFISCPHCGTTLQINRYDINCGIFRCGVYKSNLEHIYPHLSKEKCESLKNEIWGCGKPFKFDGKRISICDYI